MPGFDIVDEAPGFLPSAGLAQFSREDGHGTPAFPIGIVCALAARDGSPFFSSDADDSFAVWWIRKRPQEAPEAASLRAVTLCGVLFCTLGTRGLGVADGGVGGTAPMPLTGQLGHCGLSSGCR